MKDTSMSLSFLTKLFKIFHRQKEPKREKVIKPNGKQFHSFSIRLSQGPSTPLEYSNLKI